MGQIDASEWNRESQKLHDGKDQMNALHAHLMKQASAPALDTEIPVESSQEYYSDILREAEELLHKGTASVPARGTGRSVIGGFHIGLLSMAPRNWATVAE